MKIAVSTKLRLIAKIKGLSEQTKHIRSLMSKDLKFKYMHSSKHIIGVEARHHLLTYALLKGLPYRAAEASCRPDNKPSADMIGGIIATHMPNWGMTSLYGMDVINKWLTDDNYVPFPQPKREKKPYVKSA